MTEKPGCPDAKRSWYNGVDICSLDEKICLLESGKECPYYEKYLKEVTNGS